MQIVNLTPHTVTIRGLRFPPSGTIARCVEVIEDRGYISVGGFSVPIIAKRFGQVEGLPDPEPGVLYITSALTAQVAWAAGRTDVACPGDPVRDDEGRIVGAKALCIAPTLANGD
jgi:hypothetical protein